MGLISSCRGRMGDLGDTFPCGRSIFFHLVQDPDVLIDDSLGGFRLESDVAKGVCWSKGRGV